MSESFELYLGRKMAVLIVEIDKLHRQQALLDKIEQERIEYLRYQLDRLQRAKMIYNEYLINSLP